MSRKPKKGYYVRGIFIAEVSEIDRELRAGLKGTHESSKTDLKRESTALQALGEELLTLRADLLNRMALPEKLADALEQAKRITNFEGKRRQMQFVGKLMRTLDADTLQQVRDALEEQQKGSAQLTMLLHQAEQWRGEVGAEQGNRERWGTAVGGDDPRCAGGAGLAGRLSGL